MAGCCPGAADRTKRGTPRRGNGGLAAREPLARPRLQPLAWESRSAETRSCRSRAGEPRPVSARPAESGSAARREAAAPLPRALGERLRERSAKRRGGAQQGLRGAPGPADGLSAGCRLAAALNAWSGAAVMRAAAGTSRAPFSHRGLSAAAGAAASAAEGPWQGTSVSPTPTRPLTNWEVLQGAFLSALSHP